MTCKLVLMRHGEIKANKDQRWHGSTDSPLLWRGRRQAKRLARFAAKKYPQLAAIYASPRQRCLDTAAPLAQALKLDVQVKGDLQEWSIGELEDTPFKELAETHNFFRRSIEDLDYAIAGGESINTVARRYVDALFEIHQRHDSPDTHTNVGIVSHGAAIQVALAQLIDGSGQHWQNYSISNCSITELVLTPKPYVDAYNQAHFL